MDFAGEVVHHGGAGAEAAAFIALVISREWNRRCLRLVYPEF